ncbi:DedA family protein [Paenibacillus sp. LS1]|uniref:DedA family protein n=1 Tax=Paenibacillus sp. LS1 TaxID=2992120 RepID=UPI0022310BF6|nr:DedA family protein [Paenibacillus sp. LS1]MCW3792657.1 DedA family protein [Paenibacillus sp. LS1]
MVDYITDFLSQYGYVAITVLLAGGILGLPVPDEALMTFVGYLVSVKIMNFMLAILFSFVGSVLGMIISYLIGSKVGFHIVERYGKWVGMTPKRFEKVQRWFVKYGDWAIVFSYFIPGVRHVSGYVAGITKIPFKKYVLLCSVVALIWSVLFITIGYFIGSHI